MDEPRESARLADLADLGQLLAVDLADPRQRLADLGAVDLADPRERGPGRPRERGPGRPSAAPWTTSAAPT
jgi:hypothetical protein